MGAATISPFKRAKRDCFVASLLAMRGEWIAIAGIELKDFEMNEE
jgi:hypothetical protein